MDKSYNYFLRADLSKCIGEWIPRKRNNVLLDESESKFPILLGRRDFFENFDITFKEHDKKIVLKKV